jgi:DNA-binding NarL/FixJ family response regulator
MSLPRVLIVDDHKVVAEGLTHLLSERFEVVGAITDASLAVDAIARLRPDVVLLDLAMPRVSGFDVMRGLAERGIKTHVIVLTMLDDPPLAVEALTAGASGFLMKESSSEELVTALDTVLNGGTYVASVLTKEIVTLMVSAGAKPRTELTTEQRDVLRLVVQGRRAKEIAGVLDISTRRVETIKSRLMQRLGVQTTAELVRCAVEQHLVRL